MIKHALDSSLNKLCVDALTGSAELPLASLLFVLSLILSEARSLLGLG